MVDCADLDKRIDELNETLGDFTGIWSDQFGGCYGGYTHPDLWECDPVKPVIRVRFNASLWHPYKVLMIEAEVPFSGSCE